jgi:hypothetical protein
MIVNDHADTFTTSHTDSEHAECGGVSIAEIIEIIDRSPILTNQPLQHIFKTLIAYISGTMALRLMRFGGLIQHDFRRFLLDFEEN